ncbi:MAG TPA: HD domain-containing protein [Smithellaceae bacterium]|nr:HD domain-containing protein [Smithellaceae bacterium]
MNIIEKATRIAVKVHEGQRRKADDLPFIVHPFMVALKLAKYNFPDRVIAAALAHDILEESKYPEEELRGELGDEVAEIVKAVTNENNPDWEDKKKKYVESVRKSSEDAKAVSVADKIHNLESLLIAYAEQGPAIWEKFNVGKEQKMWFENKVLKMLKDTWQHPLIEEYEHLLEQAKELK